MIVGGNGDYEVKTVVRRKNQNKFIEPVFIDRFENDDGQEWRRRLEKAEKTAEAEGRALVIIDHPALTAEERARREEEVSCAAGDLIRAFIGEMDALAAAGELGSQEAQEYKAWRKRWDEKRAKEETG